MPADRTPVAPSATDPLAAEPLAADHQVVVAGDVRVTVLTERLLRIERSDGGEFEDRRTLAVVNRRFAEVPYRVERAGDALVVDTGAIRLAIDDVTRPFTARRVRAIVGTTAGEVTWRYGAASKRNLGGTVRTLDNWRGRTVPRVTGFDPERGLIREWDEQSLGEGLLSRDGWAVLDDSRSVVLDPAAGSRDRVGAGGAAGWPVARSSHHHDDLYLFGYGDDHRAALADGARLLGPQPLPPRWAFGYWFSRYHPYTADELIELVDDLDQNGIPADVLVVDMDWHRPGWTGYSWDSTLFPDPTATLTTLHERGLRVALNLHPADGVGAHEDAFAPVCEALGLDPATTDRVPFDATDPAFVDAYFRLLHHPEEDRGVDLWWLDWQQGTDSALVGLDPLAWLNEVHWVDQIQRRPNRRPISFSRWSGPGAGRHPIGFSGDTWAAWESLAFQPELTATAANVLYGYWSHDIGGHFGTTGPELYTRWLQFGAHSPVLRTHATLGLDSDRRVWHQPEPYRRAMVDAIRRRYELIPYLYGAARRGVDDGRSLLRPMYHEHPATEAAYDVPGQYLLGDDLIVAPVVRPCDDDLQAASDVWLPTGTWHDTATGRTVTVDEPEGRHIRGRHLLAEVPVFVRGGAIVPTQRGVDRSTHACYPNLVLDAHPGGAGGATLYEDDGTTQGYLRGRSVTIGLHQHETARQRRLRVDPASGGYWGWRARRDVEVRFLGEPPARTVQVDGREVPWSPAPTPGRWWYDADATAVVVSLPRADLRLGREVVVTRWGAARHRRATESIAGFPGTARRIAEVSARARALLGDESRWIVHLAETGRRIAAAPDSIVEELTELWASGDRLDRVLAESIERFAANDALDPTREPRETDLLRALRRMSAGTFT